MLLPLAFASTFLSLNGLRKEAVPILATLLAAYVLTFVVKGVVARSMPPAELVQILVNAEGHSFPSGHVLRIASFFGSVDFLYLWHMGPSVARPIVYGALALGMLAIGLSRIYLVVHWLGDVVGCYAFGSAGRRGAPMVGGRRGREARE